MDKVAGLRLKPPLSRLWIFREFQQIKDRQYALRFEGRCAPVAHVFAPTEAKRRQFGEKPEYTGRILAVGIAYNKDDGNKQHECKVEILRERLR